MTANPTSNRAGPFGPPKSGLRITAATKRRLQLRQQIWPDVKEEMLWNRANFTGFTTIPRTLSLIIAIIDSLDKKSAGHVYLDLWCRSFDDYVVEIRDEYEAALSSGYSGQRAIRSWRERCDVLENFGFVRTHKAVHGAYRHILLLEPHFVVNALREKGKISDEMFLTLKTSLIAIGAMKT